MPTNITKVRQKLVCMKARGATPCATEVTKMTMRKAEKTQQIEGMMRDFEVWI